MRDVVFKLIDQFTEGVDTYHNNGSMWLIFTDDKKWVIELTKDGTLWYNFYFFQDCFKYLSLDVVENQHYITEWVESIIQNGVKHTRTMGVERNTSVEDTIQNGVKEIHWVQYSNLRSVEDTIQNGIKETKHGIHFFEDTTENVIKNGIKKTKSPGADGDLLSTIEWMESNNTKSVPEMIDDVITNGIKETNWRKVDNHPTYLDNIINKGH